ncbi:heterokaryon incompatibility protein-domain-containing protein [Phyllosticta capitalensis]
MPYEYRYVELASPSTIRLIKPTRQKIDNTITYTICHVDYTKQPNFKYLALSYVWGDSSPTRYVYLIDSANRTSLLLLHENLWRCLHFISDSDLRDTWIWTDRVCLNQGDKDEIAQQVPRMGDIFRNAGLVLAWLGLSQEEAEYLMPGREEEITQQTPKMATISDKAKRVLARLGLSRGEANYSILGTPKPFTAGKIPRPQETHLEIYRKRVSITRGNPFWRRIWILQEIVNAKEVIFLLGERGLKFETVFRIFNPYFQNSPGPDLTYIWNMRRSGGKSELADLLMAITSSDFEARRPHDRVYGLLGLVAANDDGTSPLDHIDVDYNKSPWDVILDAVLESRPAFRDYPLMAEHVLLKQSHKLVEQSVFHAFKDYVCSDRTSERHSGLARLTIRACEALQIICKFLGKSTINYPMRSMLSELECSILDQQLKPTIQDRAAALGVALALQTDCEEISDMDSDSERWRGFQESQSKKSPTWRCNVHRDKESLWMFSTERKRGESSFKTHWSSQRDPLCLKEVCAQNSADEPRLCDGSALTFEIPEVGFSLVFQTLFVDLWQHDLEIRMQLLHMDSTDNGGSKSTPDGEP